MHNQYQIQKEENMFAVLQLIATIHAYDSSGP